jgi:hypothetical protein
MDPGFPRESSRCQDGIDNDGDGTLDYDAGLSVNGVADPNGPDPQCVSPWRNREVAGCGLGFELVALSPLLVWRSRRAKTVRRVNSDPP